MKGLLVIFAVVAASNALPTFIEPRQFAGALKMHFINPVSFVKTLTDQLQALATEEPVPYTEEPVPYKFENPKEPIIMPDTEEPVPYTEEPVPYKFEDPNAPEHMPATEEPVPYTEEPVPYTEEPVPYVIW